MNSPDYTSNFPTPQTAGIPYSLQKIAAWHVSPPRMVTTALTNLINGSWDGSASNKYNEIGNFLVLSVIYTFGSTPTFFNSTISSLVNSPLFNLLT